MLQAHQIKKLQQDYLIAEKRAREQTTAKYVDKSYQWVGDFT
jgi:hypothetical protein